MPTVKKSHIKLLCDHTAAVGCMNNMGSCKSIPCDKAANDKCHWFIHQEIG